MSLVVLATVVATLVVMAATNDWLRAHCILLRPCKHWDEAPANLPGKAAYVETLKCLGGSEDLRGQVIHHRGLARLGPEVLPFVTGPELMLVVFVRLLGGSMAWLFSDILSTCV